MWENIGPIIAGVALVLNVITVAIAILIKYQFAEMKLSIGEAITKTRQEIDERFERATRENGEMGHALRQKIQDVASDGQEKIQELALYIRDEFVRKETFATLMSEIKKDINDSSEKIEKKIDKVEVTIEKLRLPQSS